MQSLKALYELREIIKPQGKVSPDRRDDAIRYFKMYSDALNQSAAALPKWEATVRKPGDARGFTSKPVSVIREMVEQMRKTRAELGV
jgi:hypothetical protein